MSTIDEILGTDIYHNRDLVQQASGGDLDSITGLDNIKESFIRRLITEPGTVIRSPLYGAGLRQFSGSPMNLSNKRAIALKINEQALQDPRIEKVLGVSVEASDTRPEYVTIIVRFKVAGYDEQSISFTPFNEVAG